MSKPSNSTRANRPIDVLHVDDSSVARLFVARALDESHGYRLTSVDGGEAALNTMRSRTFDLVITDWLMRGMDGIELIRRVRAAFADPPVIIMSSSVDSPKVRLHALSEGADGFVSTPAEALDYRRSVELVLAQAPKYEALGGSLSRREASGVYRLATVPDPPKSSTPVAAQCDGKRAGTVIATAASIAVCITASTGGPNLLADLVELLPVRDEVCYLIVLHGPAWMLESFSARIQQRTEMCVALPSQPMPIYGRVVYLAPGGHHMVVDSTMRIGRGTDRPEHHLCPAADPLMRSVATAFGHRSIAVVMTGLGVDGTIGAATISAKGGVVLVQDPATCIAKSMPTSVIGAGIPAELLAPECLADGVRRAIDRQLALPV